MIYNNTNTGFKKEVHWCSSVSD